MKLSHVIVAIVFFILGVACVLGYEHYQKSCIAVPAVAAVEPVPVAAIKPAETAVAAKPASPAVSSTPKISFRIEKAVNRHGSDYRDFEMAASDGFEVCQKACADEAECLAFTFVKGGVQGTAPHCWLKNRVPQAYPDTTCVSGVRE